MCHMRNVDMQYNMQQKKMFHDAIQSNELTFRKQETVRSADV